jgi:hypothetical protein
MGSIAMNGNGDIALGYSLSSSSVFPSVYYTGRRADAPLGEMNLEEVKIIEGTGSQTGWDRWGDYACLSVDPSDDSTFWFTTEYHKTGWKTRIASFDFGPFLPPFVDAGNDTTVCETEAFQTTAQAFYHQSILWSTSGDGIFIDASKVQAVYLRGPEDVAAGEVTLRVDAEGYVPGQEVSDTMNLFFSRSARANAGPDSLICANETIMLSGSATSQDSILWQTQGDGSFDNVRIFNPVYTPGPEDISNGYVYLKLTAYDIYPCEGWHTDKVKVTIDECTGVAEQSVDGISLKVVPNPANSVLNFKVSGLEGSREITLSLSNIQGIEMFALKVPVSGGNYTNSMDVSRFPKGTYYLKAFNMKEQVVEKVILQ